MTTLALVDLDNLFGTLEERDGSPGPWVPALVPGGHRWVLDDGRDVAPAASGDRSACVVVVAANTVTIRRHGVERPFLERLARRIARVLGHISPHAVALELALVLPMPQAADRALLQLLRRAPSPSSAGTFDTVALVTADSGLIAALDGRVGSKWSKRPATAPRPLLTTYHLPARLGGHTRRHAEPPPSEAPAAPPPTGANALWIDTPEASAWAAAQHVQRDVTLVETARAVEQHPARLTQLSTTRASFRGVARLLAPGTAVVGACSPADGLEFALEVPAEARLRGRGFQASALGAGVVRVTPIGATVRTGLPAAWLLRRPQDDDVVVLGPHESRLADGELLARAAPLTPEGWMVRVRLRARVASARTPAALVAEVLAEESAEVAGWWTTDGARKPRSVLALPGAEQLVRGDVETLARHAVLADGARRELVLMAPHIARVTAATAAPRGTLAQATAGSQRLPFALLTLDRDVAAGDELAVAPVQRLDADTLAWRYAVDAVPPTVWRRLRRLPLLVPAS